MTVQSRPLPKRLFVIGPLCLLFLLILPFEEAHQVVPVLLVLLGVSSFSLVRAHWQEAMAWPALIGALLGVPLLISSLMAVNPGVTVETAVKLLVYGVMASFVAVRFRYPLNINRWWWLIVAVLLFWILDALIQYVLGCNLLGEPMRSGRLTGVFYPSIAVGTVVAHASPIIVEALRRFATSGWKRLAWLLVVPMLAVIALGGSRSSWIDFMLVMGLYILFLLFRGYLQWRWIIALVGASIVSILVLYQLSPEFQRRVAQTALLFSGEYDLVNRATAGRLPVWQSAWLGFQANPWFGFGMDHFMDFVRENNLPSRPYQYAHFFLLDVLMMAGLFGLVGYVGAYVLLMFHAWQSVGRGWDYCAVLFICALVMMFPFNTHWGFYHYRPMALMWLFITLAYGFRVWEMRREVGSSGEGVGAS